MFARGVNYWISWADLTFMLLIAGLAALGLSEQHLQKVSSELTTAKAALELLRRHSNPCADAKPFLDGFSECVSRTTGRRQSRQSGCFVTVGEDVIRFPNGRAVPLNPSAADAVAGCLYTNALQFASRDRASFDAITIHIDGHTDCIGDSGENEILGAERALSVYSRVLGRTEHDSSWQSSDAKRAFLSRIAVRSFGETRPVANSQCTEARGWPADRRVIVSVQLATENASSGGHS